MTQNSKITKAAAIVIIIFVVLVSVICISLFVYNTFVLGKGFSETYRYLLFLVLIGIRLLRPRNNKGKSLEYYENFYLSDIGDAFSDSPSSRKKLLTALRLYNQNNFSKSINILTKLIKKCNTSEELKVVYIFIAKNYDDQNLYNKAIFYYSKALEIDPGDKSANNNLGTVYLSLREYTKAIEFFNAAVRFCPDYYFGYSNLSSAYIRTGEFEIAVTYAVKAIEISPDFLPSIKNLAICYGVMQDFENMDIYLQKAVSLGADRNQIENAIDYFADMFPQYIED